MKQVFSIGLLSLFLLFSHSFEAIGKTFQLPLNGEGITFAKSEFKLSGELNFTYTREKYTLGSERSDKMTLLDLFIVEPDIFLPEVSQEGIYYKYSKDAESYTGTIQVKLNIKRFVDKYLLKPSEVMSQLSGKVYVTASTVLPEGVDINLGGPSSLSGGVISKKSVWPITVGIPSVLLLIIAFIFMGLRQKKKRCLIKDEIDTALTRVNEKYNRLVKQMSLDKERFKTIPEKLRRLNESAATLSRYLKQLKKTEQETNIETLQGEVNDLQEKIKSDENRAIRKDLDETLAEKQKVIALIEETRHNFSRYMLRLQKIDASLESILLKIPNIQALEDENLEKSVISEIDQEMELVEVVCKEINNLGIR